MVKLRKYFRLDGDDRDQQKFWSIFEARDPTALLIKTVISLCLCIMRISPDSWVSNECMENDFETRQISTRTILLGVPEVIFLLLRIGILCIPKLMPRLTKFLFYGETLATTVCMAVTVALGSSRDSAMFIWMMLTLFDFILFYRHIWRSFGACLIQYGILLTVQLVINGIPEKEELPLFIIKN